MSEFFVADALSLPFDPGHFDITIGSPPYADCPKYEGMVQNYGVDEWIVFMLEATHEALRVTKGPVIWVATNPTRDGVYWPACEGFMYQAWKLGMGILSPACWYKVDDNNGGTGIPGSGGKQWLRRDWEYVMAFKNAGPLPYANPKVHGHKPLFPPGGKARNRDKNGKRSPKAFKNPDFTNPGNVIKARVGGNHMGDDECHENEAPYPEKLPAWFIQAFCPIGGRVLDPFSGSGTTVCEAERLGRVGVGTDLRQSQVDLGMKRLTRRLDEAARFIGPREAFR